MSRWTIPAWAALGLLALGAAAPAAAEPGPEAPLETAVGAPAPGFNLKVLNPEAAGLGWLSLQTLVGAEPEDAGARVVLVSFFASWCAPCKKELPLLVELDTLYRALGLRVISISIDKDEPGIAAARKLVADHHVAYPVLSDRFNLLARRYLGAKTALPSVFLIGRDGTILSVERGYTTDASKFLRARVEAALGIKRGAAAPAARKP